MNQRKNRILEAFVKVLDEALGTYHSSRNCGRLGDETALSLPWFDESGAYGYNAVSF